MIGFVCVVVLTILHFEAVRSENFLFLNGVGSPSHNLWNQVLIEGLAANKKYNLTVITPDVYNTSFSNLHYIHLEKTYEVMYSDDSPLDIIALSKETAIQNPQGLAAFSLANCKGVLQSEGLNTILNYPNDFKFDVVVYDFLCGPCLIPLLHKFGYPPLIAISALNTPQFKVDLIGGHQYPAYVPFFASDLPNYMNFYQRLYSYILYQWEHWYRKLVYKPRIEKMIRERYDFDDLPSHEELERNTVLMILNSNFALDYAEPIQPNVIHVGGLGIQEPKPLPEDLDIFIRKGKKGSIVMSMGTNMRSDLLGQDIIKKILTTFKEIPDYNFLWKFESDELPMEKPDNVMLIKFLKQNDVLAHSGIKLFISHCGLMSTQESLWHGKPLIGVPLYGDQQRNIRQVMLLGAGERIFYQSITVENFKRTILKVLENPEYTKNAQKISKRFKDQPETPLDRAIWWIEYILRNPKPDHLQSPTVKLGSFISNGYDVLVFILLTCLLISYLAFKMLSNFLAWVERLFFRTLSKVIKID